MIDALPGIAYRFSDPGLLQEALTHKSVGQCNYERLEFLGDSILSLVVSTRLFEVYPDASEGDLSRMRARLVRGRTLTEVALQLQLGRQLRLGQGEMKSGGFRRSSILADALEAVFGAIYIDGGFEACKAAIIQLLDPMIHALPDVENLKDAKTRLQEWLQARGAALPHYELVMEEGADHAKRFHILCRLADQNMELTATGSSRRSAEQAAAAALLERLGSARPGT